MATAQHRFRLLTEYHSFLRIMNKRELSAYIKDVSVSLRSIIHSYFGYNECMARCVYSFRLLTEYHSFLQ